MFRPILSRGETIDSCCSEDLVTVLEVNKKEEEKRPWKVMKIMMWMMMMMRIMMMMMMLKVTDRFRLFRKGIMAASLEDLIIKGKLNNSNIFTTCKNSNFPRAQSGISLSTRFCA